MYMHLHTYMYTPGPAGGFSLTKGTHGRKMYTHAEFAWLATFYLPHTATVSSACLLANFCVVMCVVRVRTNGALKCGGVAYTLLSASFVCVRVSIVSAVFPFVF